MQTHFVEYPVSAWRVAVAACSQNIEYLAPSKRELTAAGTARVVPAGRPACASPPAEGPGSSVSPSVSPSGASLAKSAASGGSSIHPLYMAYSSGADSSACIPATA